MRTLGSAIFPVFSRQRRESRRILAYESYISIFNLASPLPVCRCSKKWNFRLNRARVLRGPLVSLSATINSKKRSSYIVNRTNRSTFSSGYDPRR